jgi:hypothetical protein
MTLPLVRERVPVRFLKGECGIGSRADVTLKERLG